MVLPTGVCLPFKKGQAILTRKAECVKLTVGATEDTPLTQLGSYGLRHTTPNENSFFDIFKRSCILAPTVFKNSLVYLEYSLQYSTVTLQYEEE